MSHVKCFSPVDPKQSLPRLEHEMIAHWDSAHIFEKSVAARKEKKKFVFFDGPPFANGLPHYGHILANALKDAVTRYWTMRGYFVPRTNGWDCHGLPVEYEIEKELKLSGRKDIEKMGVENFNSACRKSVFRYTAEWEKLMRRIFRWVDFGRSYATLDNDYMESIWWVFKEIWSKKMVYQDYKPMHICPRCETSLSNFEVTLGYKDVADLSVTIKFPLKDEKNTFFLAWTTTSWSLPGVMGLAVGPDLNYVKVRTPDGSQYYLAEDRVAEVFKGVSEYEVLEKLKGKNILNKPYTHPFPYYEKHPDVQKCKNAFHTLSGNYVSTEDGTGIVTINGAFGEIDYNSARAHNLPVLVNVKTDGHFDESMGEFSGMYVKEAEPKLADYLSSRGFLFRKDSIRHSYPHCWRCDTPLLNYATKSWFISVTKVKDELLKNNAKINWVPEHIKEGRFGKWLEGARDWNISRNRFWGCPIPIWVCPKGTYTCIGSLKELRERSTGGSELFVVRHGEAAQNALGIVSEDSEGKYHLTERGKKQALEAARTLREKAIDMIIASPVLRARETAEIIGKELGVPVEIERELREHGLGTFEGAPLEKYRGQFADDHEWYEKKSGGGGESFRDMERRVIDFVNGLTQKHSGKRIVIVTHGDSVRALARCYDRLSIPETHAFIPDFATPYHYTVGTVPMREGKLDLHKPYIDAIELECTCCGGSMKRIPEVLDCWFESGAMPYAQLHYPFENKKDLEDNFPANFIAEGVDQTRGWFYTLHVLASILFNKPAFKNVIVNGILLAADGEKLSKRKKNYPDPSALFEKHGVDPTRMFLYASTAPLAEDVRFSERYLEEMVKQFFLPLWNTYSFFVTYANIDGWRPSHTSHSLPSSPMPRPALRGGGVTSHTSVNKLDEWIISELHTLIQEVTENMDRYNFTQATRPMLAFVDKLSNWYVRRSRRRFWKSESDSDKSQAYETLYEVLVKASLLLAPFMPATAEAIYRNLTGKESVHLADWPEFDASLIRSDLNREIEVVRVVVSLALRIRAQKNIKVRQPLRLLQLVLPSDIDRKLVLPYEDVILEEINVKKCLFASANAIAVPSIAVDARKVGPRFGKETQQIIRLAREGKFELQKDGEVLLKAENGTCFTLEKGEFSIGYTGKEGFDVACECGLLVSLDTTLTPELRREGIARDIVRLVQELRKKADYHISDRIYVAIQAPKEIEQAVTACADFIRRETLALEIQEGGDFEWDKEESYEIDSHKVKIAVRKG